MATASPTRVGASLTHVAALDGIRALAVLAVIYHHWINDHLPVSAGVVGVNVFFVLSGMLITRILLVSRFHGEGTLRDKLATFYVRRTLRIFPLYYAVLLLCALISVWFRELWPWYVSYLQNIRMMREGTYLFAPHFWTLAIEEQFYLVWPLVLLTLPARAIGRVLVALIVIAPLWRFVGYVALGLNSVQVLVFTLASLDSLAAGGLLAWLMFNDRRPSPRTFAAIGAAGVAVMVAHVLLDSVAFSLTMLNFGVALASFALIGLAASGGRSALNSFLSAGPLVYIGRISYGIYVYHFFVPANLGRFGVLLQQWGGRPLYHAGALATTLVIAAVSWHVFERTINNFKERWAPNRKPQPSAPAMVVEGS